MIAALETPYAGETIMCDETWLAEWAKQQIDRRSFAKLGAMVAGGAALAACGTDGMDGEPGQPGDAMATLPAMAERSVSFATPDGTMDAFFVAPVSGPAPAVILWPDIAGLREAKREMARGLAGQGYAVLAVNPYYRDVAGEQFADFAAFIAAKGFGMVKPWREKLSSDAVGRDAKAAVAWLDAQEEVDTTRGIGAEGYCMGGPFTVYSAYAVPDRIKAAASFHGGGLVRDDDQSPHRLLAGSTAGYLFAIAQDDDAEAPDDKTALRTALNAADRDGKVEVYAGDHGWTVPDSPAYDEAAARRAYADKMALYSAALA